MSEPGTPTDGLLTVSLLYHADVDPATVLEILEQEYGSSHAQLPPLSFDFTDYYREEMGEPLLRTIYSFSRLFPRDQLAEAKLISNQLESNWCAAGKRLVNLDPGLITRENFLLATGKNFSHRVYLQRGIYADLTLIFQQGEFQPLPWTYADYRTGTIRSWLSEQRLRLLKDLAAE